MFSSLPIPVLDELASSADAWIAKAIADRRKLPKPHEPQLVRAVMENAVPEFTKEWQDILNPFGRTLLLQQVFCHSTPQVSFESETTPPLGCELADLLLVVEDHTYSSFENRRRAALIQAKIADSGDLRLKTGGGDQKQFELMSSWPKFIFKRADLYKQHRRDLRHGPYNSQWSAEYGCIGTLKFSWLNYLICEDEPFSETPPITGGTSLGSHIGHMLRGTEGYGRPCLEQGRDAWSELIDELLQVTFHEAWTKRDRTLRGSKFPMFLREDISFRFMDADGDGDEPIDDFPEGERPDGAISVLRFILVHSERDEG